MSVCCLAAGKGCGVDFGFKKNKIKFVSAPAG